MAFVLAVALMPAFSSTALAEEPVCRIEGTGMTYSSLGEAVSSVTDGTPTTITLLRDATGGGVKVPSGRNITFELGGFTYTVTNPTVGSAGTETNGFQLLKDSNITFRNGTITAGTSAALILIQNYSNLTLDNVKLLGISKTRYIVSNNYGESHFKNGTEISAPNGVAFDCYYGMSSVYDGGVFVTIDDDSVVINGKVEYDVDPSVANRLPEGVSSKEEMLAQRAVIIVPENYPPLALSGGLALVGSDDGQMKVVAVKAGNLSARFGEGTISGQRGMLLGSDAVVTVAVENCTLAENADPTNWKLNLPAGVKIKSYNRASDTAMMIQFSGVPVEGKQGYITGKIPANDIISDAAADKDLEIIAAARWSIAVPVPAGPVWPQVFFGLNCDRNYRMEGLSAGVPATAVALSDAASGGKKPYVYSVVQGPAWLIIDAAKGILSGVPTKAAAAQNAVVSITDAVGQTVMLKVAVGAVKD